KKEGQLFDTGRDFDEETVRKFFEDKNINPETISNLFQSNKKGADYLEGMYPQLQFENHAEEIMSDIRNSSPNGFTSPTDLLSAIAKHIRGKMSYDMLTVLFEKPGEENYASMIRQTMSNPSAKFAVSSKEKDGLMYFCANLQANGNFSPSEREILTDISIYGKDINWLREKAVKDPKFINLLKKITKQYGAFLHNSKHEGILRTNENTSRDIHTVLNTVRVGVCRDFAIMTKKIYEKMAKETFPDSEAIYVNNIAKRHAYILLAYEKDGKIEKHYFDPTTFITGGSLRVPQNDTYGNEKDEVWAKNEQEDQIILG
ncbi:MAG: hypothetical protein Q8K26_01750, partial [Candidatus Gracilibacteria bacterium]|nr:hypothetical protein [Candidatus Gracilibacteria bacterium]